MKKKLFLVLLLLSCASCDSEKEDFTPFPGGKSEQLPQKQT
jgi:hypothetical protein